MFGWFYDVDRQKLNSLLTEVRNLRVELSEGLVDLKHLGDVTVIDTTKILAAVAEETTELKSWEALAAAQSDAMKTLADALKAAIDASDPDAIARVQADLDQAATQLSADNAEAAAAIIAHTPAG